MSLEPGSPYYDDSGYTAAELQNARLVDRSLDEARVFVSGKPVRSAAGSDIAPDVADVILAQSLEQADFLHNRIEQKMVQESAGLPPSRRGSFDQGLQDAPWN